MNAETAASWILMYAVVPLWIVAGLADWACHRRTSIERTSGLPENVFHWFLFAEAGVLLVAAALLEVNAGLLVLVFAAFLAHELTTYIELRYTVRLREVGPFEQMVHSFMEILPLAVLALLAVMQWEQALALFDLGVPDFSLRPRQDPLPASWLLGAAVAVLVLNVVPLFEESVRCVRGR